MSEILSTDDLLTRGMRRALLVGAIWIVAVILGWIFQPQAFYRAYLFSWLLWLGVALGSLGAVMLHHLTGGGWGWAIRRLGEATAMTLPLLAVLFIPIAIGMHTLYPWAQSRVLAVDPILRHRQPYMSQAYVIGRAAIYGILWIGMAWYLWSRSLRHDRTADPRTEFRMHHISAVGMLIYFLTMSLASVDWIMSLEPHWYSTVFGLAVICGQGVEGLCFLIIVLTLLVDRPPFRLVVRSNHYNDLGNLLLTVVILWSYMTFVQLLVSWMGNKQDEIPWYTQRLSNGWIYLGGFIVVFHFAVPYVTLLMREAKRKAMIMFWLCVMLLILRAVVDYWMVGPSGDDRLPLLGRLVNWMDFVFPIGMGGLCVAMTLWLLRGRPLVAEGDTVPLPEPLSA